MFRFALNSQTQRGYPWLHGQAPYASRIRPSTLPRDDEKTDDEDNDDAGRGGGAGRPQKNTGSRKRKKKLTLHKTEIIQPDDVPAGSRLLGYEQFIVQDVPIQPWNTRYRLARYRYQYYHQRVTQPLILQQLSEWGVDISSGQISHILTEEKADFHAEKDALFSAAINNSTYIQVDDTGARHKGNNGYCTHIGNESFAWFSSTGSKSRINFLQLLRGAALDYVVNAAALEYMRAAGLPQTPLKRIEHSPQTGFDDEAAWHEHLQRLGIGKARHIRIATEGFAL